MNKSKNCIVGAVNLVVLVGNPYWLVICNWYLFESGSRFNRSQKSPGVALIKLAYTQNWHRNLHKPLFMQRF